jgi:hypothetical protein
VFERNKVNISESWPCVGGLDFGYRDPTAGLRIARAPDDTFYVYAEYYVQGSDDIHIPQHVDWFRNALWSGENPLGESYSDTHHDTVATYKREGLFNIHPVAKHAGSVVAGIALINQLMSTGRILISRLRLADTRDRNLYVVKFC